LSVVLASGGVGGAYWLANDKWDDVPNAQIDADTFAEEASGEPANFLVIGSDTRRFVDTDDEAESFGDPDVESGQRSDTIMIAHVDTDSDKSMLVSFPRDLWVNIPGVGPSKINAAFNHGPQKVIETITSNFDVPIHHYLEVDFAGFQRLVDAVGGVPIRFPSPARDTKSGLRIERPGCYDMNGRDALAYVRSRFYEYYDSDAEEWKLDPTFDLGRIRRQQYFIRSLAEVAIKTAAVHPLRSQKILDTAFDSLTKDRNLGLSDVARLGATMRETDPAGIEMRTVPVTPDHIDEQDVLVLDAAKAAPIFERLRFVDADEPPPPTAPAGVDPVSVRVEVLNGSGKGGQAQATLEALAAAGFTRVDPPANADRDDYEVTRLRFVGGARKKAQLVAAYLGVGKLERATLEAGVDVQVVLGTDFEQVSPPTTLPPTTTAPAVTTTTGGPAANPGRTPGAAPQPVVGC
jgi:LCP family protein required for cell wall assembly